MQTPYEKPKTDEKADEPEAQLTPEEERAKYEAQTKAAEEDAELVRIAKERYRIGINATASWREEALEDLEFLAGEQWDPQVKGRRDSDGRPALTINRLPQFVRQITNEQRQAKPSITVSPVDSEGDIRTAEVLQGIVRNIEYNSNADAAYASGGQSAAITGLGYWDVCAEYEDEKSFEQKLTIRRIANPLAVTMDPGAKEIAGDDARWVVISSDISKAEWEATYPGKDIPKGGDWSGEGDAPADWVAHDGVRLHEYRYITQVEDELIDVSELNPLVLEALKHAGVDTATKAVLASEVGPDFAQKLKGAGAQMRPTTKRSACWAKIAGDEVVEKGELAGRYLQLVRVVGAELNINGKSIFEGVIRHAKDTQRALNYFVSSETEAIALAPKAPFIAAEGQIEGYEEQWRDANKRPQAVLTYKPQSIAGVAVPPPTRVMAEANISAITTARQMAGEDMSSVTGIYPTQFGAPAPEQSGKAILARQSQGQTSNFHFQDNFAMAVRYTGRILIDLIPIIYSGPRIMRILGEDDTQEMVPVNGAQGEVDEKTGEPVVQLNAGRYDVGASLGPSYLSRRQEAAAQMLELARINPAISNVAGDLLVGSMDIPGGQQIAERLRKLLPPEIRPPEDNQPPPQVLANQVKQMQGMLQQSQAMIGQLSDALHKAHDRIDAKEQDVESKERIALINAQTELVKTLATIKANAAEAMLERTHDLISRRLELDGLSEPMDESSTTETPRGPLAPLKVSPPQGAPYAAQPQPGANPFGAGRPQPGPGPNPGVLFPGASPFGATGPGGGVP